VTLIEYLEHRGAPADLMVNHVLEVDESGAMVLLELPSPPE
jgi:hypothetical protein